MFFFLKNQSSSYGQYFQKARKENLETVTYVHKKPLLDYLEGKVETCTEIDAKIPNLPASSTGAKRSLERTEETKEASDKKKIQKIEQGPKQPPVPVHSDGHPDNPDDWSIEQIYAQEKGRFNSRDCMVRVSSPILCFSIGSVWQRTHLSFSNVLTFARELLSEKGSRGKKVRNLTALMEIDSWGIL